MRRIELINGVNTLIKALEESGLKELFLGRGDRRMSENEESRPNVGQGKMRAIEALQAFLILHSRFDQATLKLFVILGLNTLIDPGLWSHMIVESRDGPSAGTDHIRQRVEFAFQNLPLVAALLGQSDLDEFIKSDAARKVPSEDYQTLSVIILEEKGEFSRPERLVEVLNSVTELYGACARLGKMSGDQLAVLSCDSGSDKSFDFLGLAKLVQQVKEIILGLWERVVFHKEARLSMQIKVLAEGLPVLAKVAEMEKAGQLVPEEAGIIRRDILSGCERFIKAGAIIPEIEAHTVHNPRALMGAEKKLLMGPSNTAETSFQQPEPETPEIQSEKLISPYGAMEMEGRLAEMEKMLSKFQKEQEKPKRKAKEKKTKPNLPGEA